MRQNGLMTLVACFLITFSLYAVFADDWSQWRGTHRDGVWKETGLIEKFDSAEIKVRWRVLIANDYSGPTVANGRVHVMDRVVEPKEQERVHCFDWKTGQAIWSHAYDCVYNGVQALFCESGSRLPHVV